jgi:hypothetical protein
MKRLIFIVIILILSCNGNKKTDKIVSGQKTQSEFNLAKSDYTILTYQSEWHWIFKNAKTAELSESELNDIEKILRIAVEENNDSRRIALKNNPNKEFLESRYKLKMDGFKRQYVPIINSEGQKEVWINLFCDDFGMQHWKSELFEVEDGGNCHYNLKINLETKKYYALSINGYA